VKNIADNYPQWFNMSSVTANGSTFATQETVTPVRRQESFVMEILAVQWRVPWRNIDSVGATSPDTERSIQAMITTTQQTAIISIANATVIDREDKQLETQFAEATETGGAGVAAPTITLNDFATSGRGFLSAANVMHLAVDSNDSSYADNIDARILYRLVRVSSAELIGIIEQ